MVLHKKYGRFPKETKNERIKKLEKKVAQLEQEIKELKEQNSELNDKLTTRNTDDVMSYLMKKN